MPTIHRTIGRILQLRDATAPRRDQRGLSQSTENAILLAGAVAVAVIIIGVITEYVRSNLPG